MAYFPGFLLEALYENDIYGALVVFQSDKKKTLHKLK
jgi:hypothetical protein